MKIIITGATGFVGKNLVEYLSRQLHEVRPLSLRGSWQLETAADAVIHLAGKAHDTANTSAEKEYFNVNTDLTKELFDQFQTSEIKDFFYFSSVKAVADEVAGVLDENHPADPKTPYGKSKLQAEQHLLAQKLPKGKRLFIIRPCMIHGPGNKGNLNLLYKVVNTGLPWPLAAFDNKRSFLSIDNLNFLVSEILHKHVKSGVYNFADDEPLSTNEVVEIMARTSNRMPKLLKIPKKWVQKLAKIGGFLGLPLNTERLKKLTENYMVSNKKIKAALAIEKLPVHAKDGLRITFDSFKK